MDLSTTYLGFELPHPFIAGASPLADTLDGVQRLQEAGAAAIVMRSLFEEQIRSEALATQQATESHAESYGEALSYFPSAAEFVLGPHEYLEHIRRIKQAVDVPVVASLNGASESGWAHYAQLMEQAGADAIELNLYNVPTDAQESGEAIEQREIQIVEMVKRSVGVPVAVKLSPFYTSLAHMVRRLEQAGADGLVLLNRFFEPDIDVDELEVLSRLVLSTSAELLLRLRWLAIVSGSVQVSLAVSGGVHSALDAIKAIMCGAHAVQMVSVLLMHSPRQLQALRQALSEWMEEKEYTSLQQMRGSMDLTRGPAPERFGRANYIQMLQTWE